ncbi:hypothetical protein M3J09_002679 [Ascochyta lentis]
MTAYKRTAADFVVGPKATKKPKRKRIWTTSRAEEASKVEPNPTTEQNRTHSPLLRLPGEIRNRIYDYVFENHDVIVRKFQDRTKFFYHVSEPFPSDHCGWVPWLGLLQIATVCRDLHAETELLPYSMSTFSLDDRGGFRSWYIGIGRKRQLSIRTIQVSRHSSWNLLCSQLCNIRKLPRNKIEEVVVVSELHWSQASESIKKAARSIARKERWTLVFRYTGSDLS